MVGDREASRALEVLCGTTFLAGLAERCLSDLGVEVRAESTRKLVLDSPTGYALATLSAVDATRCRVAVITWNTCPEYLEDVWELGPHVLIEGQALGALDPRAVLSEALRRLDGSRRHRHTLGEKTCLTGAERTVLRGLAFGLDNRTVALRAGIKEQTMKNTLTEAYRKTGVHSHGEAVLYYWGLRDAFEETFPNGPPL